MTYHFSCCLLLLIYAEVATTSCKTFQTLPANPPMPLNQMTIATAASIQYTDQQADAALAEVQKILSISDGPDDSACPVQVNRIQPVFQYNSTIQDINSQADFEALLSVPGYIKLVRSINYCGGIPVGVVLGCAPINGGGVMATLQTVVLLQANIFTHEYGHNMGLLHVCEVSNGNCTAALQLRVMYPMALSTARQVTFSECQAYKRINVILQLE